MLTCNCQLHRQLTSRLATPWQARHLMTCVRTRFTARFHASPPDIDPVLGDLRVVLVSPKGPVNIGAVARVCANFEAPNLVLVAPRCDPYDGEVYKMACGESIISSMQVVDTLEEALSSATSSIGFTRRGGCTRLTHSSIGDMLEQYPDAIPGMLTQQGLPPTAGVTALVFGREENGLTEAELRLCAHACAIPTGRIQSSMNLSHAAAVVLAELYHKRLEVVGSKDLGLEVTGNPDAQAGLQPVTAAELGALLSKIAAIAEAVGLSGEESQGGGNQGSHGRRRLPVGHIRAVLSRGQANTWEVRSLHGLASAVLKMLTGSKELPDSGITTSSSSSTSSNSSTQQ